MPNGYLYGLLCWLLGIAMGFMLCRILARAGRAAGFPVARVDYGRKCVTIAVMDDEELGKFANGTYSHVEAKCSKKTN